MALVEEALPEGGLPGMEQQVIISVELAVLEVLVEEVMVALVEVVEEEPVSLVLGERRVGMLSLRVKATHLLMNP